MYGNITVEISGVQMNAIRLVVRHLSLSPEIQNLVFYVEMTLRYKNVCMCIWLDCTLQYIIDVVLVIVNSIRIVYLSSFVGESVLSDV